jgi:hypothetical protein
MPVFFSASFFSLMNPLNGMMWDVHMWQASDAHTFSALPCSSRGSTGRSTGGAAPATLYTCADKVSTSEL